MKVDPREKENNKNFEASVFSSKGFLGNGMASVDDLIVSDTKEMIRLNVTSADLSNFLEFIYVEASRALGAEVKIKSNVSARFFESRGKIPSPFRGHGVFAKGEVILLDKVSGSEIVITDLGISMIREYSFFQGYGSRYRIDPEAIVKIMNSDK